MRILFIDPYFSYKEAYVSALHKAGFEVIFPAEHGVASFTDTIKPEPYFGSIISTVAIKFIECRGNLDDIDLVITEHIMLTPEQFEDGVNGDVGTCEFGTRVAREIIRRIRLNRPVRIGQPRLPIIILSCVIDVDEIKRNGRLPDVFYFRKDQTSPDQLVVAVIELLEMYAV